MSFSETTVYLICFLHHTQASCVRIHHTDFSQNMAAIYSSELTPCFISQSHIHFLHISIIAMWKFCTATVRISFFITHIVYYLSILLSSCNNFACSHKSVRKCTYRHHANFIFAIKQSIFVSFITRVVAKTILHAHYFVNLQMFLSSTINFLSTSMTHHYFFITASQRVIIFCHVCSIRLLL